MVVSIVDFDVICYFAISHHRADFVVVINSDLSLVGGGIIVPVAYTLAPFFATGVNWEIPLSLREPATMAYCNFETSYNF